MTPRFACVPALLAGVLLALAPAAADAKITWVVRGAGWGHGVGMSAYGAYGYGLNGTSYSQILAHYYTGIDITTLDKAPRVRVLLTTRSGTVSFTRAKSACGRTLSPSRTYRARRSGATVKLVSASGSTLARCGKRLRAYAAGKMRVRGVGTYRGALEAVSSGGRLYVVNRLGVNAYVQGSLPAELFPSWPAETLKAFAVAQRSIALTSNRGGSIFDVYPDTRSQLYRGVGVETRETNAAVKATVNQVATYAGEIAQTTYFSSSGGKTESGFLGAPEIPYLQSVDDPYDYYSPRHRWTFKFSQAQMNSRLGPYLKGGLRRIKVTKRGDSPRIDTAQLIGTGGTTTVTGDTLRSALGLYDRWAYFKKVSG